MLTEMIRSDNPVIKILPEDVGVDVMQPKYFFRFHIAEMIACLNFCLASLAQPPLEAFVVLGLYFHKVYTNLDVAQAISVPIKLVT